MFGHGQQKDGKVSATKKKQLEEHFATNWANLQKLSSMSGYKENISEKQSFLKVHEGRSSPVCKKNNPKTASTNCGSVKVCLNVKLQRL